MEIRHNFKNAEVITGQTDPSDYHRQIARRGDRPYIMSRSELCLFADCPSKWRAGAKHADSEATEWGTLIDCLILDPVRFTAEFAVKPSHYTNDKGEQKNWNGNAKICEAWADEHVGKIHVKHNDMNEANFAVARLKRDKQLWDYIECSRKQVAVFADYHDKETGLIIPVKALLDLVPPADHPDFGRSLADFKTSRSAAPRKWTRSIFDLEYYIQAALYLDMYVAATGEDRVEFRHLVQENVPPYETARRILSAEFIEMGRSVYLSAMRRYAQCLADDKWPSWDDADNGGAKIMGGWRICEPEPWMVNQ